MKTVFLDLDGTLTDPKVGITRSVIHALHALGHEAPTPDDLEWVIGPPLVESFRILGVDDPDHAVTLYRERFATQGLFENTPYPGVKTVLETLAARHRLCLATAKPLPFAQRITARFGLDRHLFAQFGAGLDGTFNDKADLLAHALDEVGIAASDAVMVGDRHHDIDAARAVGMASIAVTWGYGRPEEHGHATATCARLSELPATVASVLEQC